MNKIADADFVESPAQWKAANPGYVTPKLELTDPIRLHGQTAPERRWIVPGWLPHGNVTMLGGDGGTGKSLAIQQLATACAIGRDWLGRPVTPCRVLSVYCEDDEDEVWRRQEAINRHYGIEMGDLENLKWVSRVARDNLLMTWDRFEAAGEPTEFFQQIHNAASDFGAQLVPLDSLHDLFGGNENVRPHARQFVQLLRGLARDLDGAVILTAHPSLSGRNTGTGEAGSTAWNNAVRSRLYLTKPKADDGPHDPDLRVLARKKANYAGADDELVLHYEAGVFVAEQQPTGIDAASTQQRAERVFLSLIRRAEQEGRIVSDAKNGSNYAPRIFSRRPDAEGLNRTALERAMEALFAKGKIEVKETGSGHRRKRSIVPTKEEQP